MIRFCVRTFCTFKALNAPDTSSDGIIVPIMNIKATKNINFFFFFMIDPPFLIVFYNMYRFCNAIFQKISHIKGWIYKKGTFLRPKRFCLGKGRIPNKNCSDAKNTVNFK